jgi:cell division protein FtsL
MVRRKYSIGQIAAWSGLALLVAAVLTFYLWHLNENMRMGLDKARLESALVTTRQQVERLQARKAQLLAPDRVEKIAKAELKLAEPRTDQIVYEER